MTFHLLTIFPEMFSSPMQEGVVSRAIKNGTINIHHYNLRDYSTNIHRTVDGTPCGGGPGMVLKVDVMDRALKNIKKSIPKNNRIITILLTPGGEIFNQKYAKSLSEKYDDVILICGRYEGFDYRIHQHLVDAELSIGNFVMSGGEIPAMVIIDTVSRIIPGVIKKESVQNESFEDGDKIDYPVFTRPIKYKRWSVPDVLLQGNHKDIENWRKNHQKN